MDIVKPEGWPDPKGYSNGILADPGRLLFIAGQVGWDSSEEFRSSELAPQFEQALKNVVAVLDAAGGKPRHICRMTAYCTDKAAYLVARPELGQIWRRIIGQHYPAMSMIFVVDLLDSPGMIELEATAVLPISGG